MFRRQLDLEPAVLQSKVWKKVVNQRAIVNGNVCNTVYNVLVTNLEIGVVVNDLDLMIRVLLIPLLQCIGCQASGCQLDLVASVCQILKGGQRLIICR